MQQKEVREMRRYTKMRGWMTRWAARLGYAAGIVTIAWPARVLAATAGGTLPWDAPLNTLQTDLQGPVAHAITTAAIIGTGLMWSVSEHGTGVRKMSAVAFGGSAALGAATLMTTLFPLGGALF
jgi:type IV secretion system protein TrbC